MKQDEFLNRLDESADESGSGEAVKFAKIMRGILEEQTDNHNKKMLEANNTIKAMALEIFNLKVDNEKLRKSNKNMQAKLN